MDPSDKAEGSELPVPAVRTGVDACDPTAVVVLPFRPLAEQPHETATLICLSCGKRAVHVWPARTRMVKLQCDGCERIGTLVEG